MTTSRGNTVVDVGARVVSADGKQLGVVKEALTDRFQVDVRWAPDYWLGAETVDNASEGIVQLLITKEGLGPAKLRGEVKGPGLGGADPPGAPPAPF